MRIRKILPIVIPVILILIAIVVGNFYYVLYSPFLLNTTQYITNLNDDVKTMLSDKYKLTISDDIVFVDGHYDNAFQDNSVYLTLRVPDDRLSSFYDMNHYKDTSSVGDKDIDGVTIQKRLEYEGELYTYINIYSSEDGYTLVKFTGRYPGSRPGV